MKSTSKPNVLAILAPCFALVALCCCDGQSGDPPANRILSGAEFEPGMYPFMAQILAPSREGGWVLICTGTVLDRQHILSSANCFVDSDSIMSPKDLEVRLGCHWRSNCASGSIYGVSRVMVHHRFLQNLAGLPLNDVALLKLDSMIEFKPDAGLDAIDKVELAQPFGACCDTGRRPLGSVGWGGVNRDPNAFSEALLKTRLYSEPLQRCNSTWEGRINTKMVCARNADATACVEDFGGPLLLDWDLGRATQVGIVSYFAPPCGAMPIISTKVAPFRKWIDNCTSGKGCETL